MPYRHLHRVLIDDIDAAGVAFFARLLAIAHQAYEHACANAGLSLATLINERRFGLPLVHVEADFTHPVRHGDALVALVHCEGISESSYTCRIELVIESAGKNIPAAVIRQVHACIDPARGASVPLPDAIRAALTQLK